MLGIALSRDGALAAVGSEDGTVSLWRLADRALLRRLPVNASWVKGVAFSPDGQLLATVGIQQERALVKVWSVGDGQLRWEQDGGAEIGDVVCFTVDGETVLGGFWDGSVRQWRAADGVLLREVRAAPRLHDRVSAIVIAPNGGLAAFVYDYRTFELRNTRDWKRHKVFEGAVGGLKSVAFSPDGALLATGSSIDNAVQVWDTSAGRKPFVTLRGHTSTIEGLAFTPDQTRIISAARDGTARVWGVVGN